MVNNSEYNKVSRSRPTRSKPRCYSNNKMYRDNAPKIVCTPRLWGYDLLAFFLERPFNTPPRRMERVLDFGLGLASWEAVATMGVATVGGFRFLR